MCLCRSACSLCVSSADAEADAEAEAGAGAGADVAAGSLALLEAVVSYSLLPRSALRPFVAALCRTVNLEPYCETSWKVRPVHRGQRSPLASCRLVHRQHPTKRESSSRERSCFTAAARNMNYETRESFWFSQLMRCVVGGDIGHAALQEMVEILRGEGEGDAALLRGAVFYINMALWGPRRVPTLKVSFLAVLPAFLKVRRLVASRVGVGER